MVLWSDNIHIHAYTHTHKYTYTQTHTQVINELEVVGHTLHTQLIPRDHSLDSLGEEEEEGEESYSEDSLSSSEEEGRHG